MIEIIIYYTWFYYHHVIYLFDPLLWVSGYIIVGGLHILLKKKMVFLLSFLWFFVVFFFGMRKTTRILEKPFPIPYFLFMYKLLLYKISSSFLQHLLNIFMEWSRVVRFLVLTSAHVRKRRLLYPEGLGR